MEQMGKIFGNVDQMLADDPAAWSMSPLQLQARIRQLGYDKLRQEMYNNYISPGLRGSSSHDRLNALAISDAVPRLRVIDELTK